MLAALDVLTDQPGHSRWRGDYDALCVRVREAQALLLDAHAAAQGDAVPQAGTAQEEPAEKEDIIAEADVYIAYGRLDQAASTVEGRDV